MKDEAELIAFARAVVNRIETATIPVCRDDLWIRDEADGSEWRPRPHNCYRNVATWVHNVPQHRMVMGYVIFDLPLYIEVVPHAVVEIEDGTLMDITPSGVTMAYPFVRHVGTDEEFDDMKRAIRVQIPKKPIR
jgi:hypothetical protein